MAALLRLAGSWHISPGYFHKSGKIVFPAVLRNPDDVVLAFPLGVA
jgi:hypothetical protein